MIEDPVVSELRNIQNFSQLKKFLSEEMNWPVGNLEIEDLTFDYEPSELGLKPNLAAKIKVIKRLRALAVDQPWGIFFIEFEKKSISIEVLRRILGHVAITKRAGSRKGDHVAWSSDDLLFISNYGDNNDRRISFAQFMESDNKRELAKLRVIDWDASDATLHLAEVVRNLTKCLKWPEDVNDISRWREQWRQAFHLGHREVIRTSENLAIRLAELAKLIRHRMVEILESETINGPFQRLMKGFRDSLVEDLDEKSFSDMYAQTITYGLLSARISGANLIGHDEFTLNLNASPFLRELMEALLVADGSRGTKKNLKINFDELGLQDVVDELNRSKMDDIVRNFGDQKSNEDPVTHFYETFLAKYDPVQRAQRGVFYTPQSVVRNIVKSVHSELINSHGIPDGLASTLKLNEVWKTSREKGNIEEPDFAVSILDPATGTGTFLVEVIEVIYQTLNEKWTKEGLNHSEIATRWSEYVPANLLPRLVGYELLMAPYSIAHLKIALKLLETGYKFKSSDRINVFLTNALSGPRNFEETLDFAIPALDHEAHAVNEIKSKRRFAVVLGNPPYSGISSNMGAEFTKIVEPYKYIDGEHFGEKKHWLQDDYVKFTRLAESQIELSGFGVIGYIMNHAFIDNPTFRGMRWHLMETFDDIFILDIHGNVMKKEISPSGLKNENVFDIQQGVAITIMSKLRNPQAVTNIHHGDIWGTRSEKYAILKTYLIQDLAKTKLNPQEKFYFFYEHQNQHSQEYMKWLQLSEIFNVYAGGFITARDHFVVDTNKELLLERIGEFRSEKYTDLEIREKYFKGLGSDKYEDGDTRGWKLLLARRELRKDKMWKSRSIQCLYRPFDNRWVYWTENMVDWIRPETNGHLLHTGNIGLVFMRQVASGSKYSHVMVSRTPVEARACYSNKGGMTLAPLFLHEDSNRRSQTLFSENEEKLSNLSSSFLNKVLDFHRDHDSNFHQKCFDYIVGILNSTTYRDRYESLLKVDFPRIPIPKDQRLFSKISSLGAKISGLQLMEVKLPSTELPKFFGSKTAQIDRVSWQDDVLWIDSKSKQDAPGTTGFKFVSREIFEFELGGYRVCEKWFKDRRGHALTEEEIAYVRLMLGSITKLIQCQKEIDTSVLQFGGFPNAFI